MNNPSPAEKAWEGYCKKQPVNFRPGSYHERNYFAGFSSGVEHERSRVCEWRTHKRFSGPDWHESGCGNGTNDSQVPSDYYKACPFCGGKIVEVE